jgi:hypothetical protein
MSSPFVIGVCEDLSPDTGEADRAAAVDAAVEFLRHLERLMPHTEIRLMLGSHGPVSLAIADRAGDAAISIVEPCDESDLTATATAAERSSLLLVIWHGAASSSGADIVTRFLRVHGTAAILDAGEPHARTESDGSEHVVFWVPTGAPEGGVAPEGAAAPRPAPGYLVAAGEEVIEQHAAMPPMVQHVLAELDEFNLEFQRYTRAGYRSNSTSLMADLPEGMDAADVAVLRSIDGEFVKADALAGHMQWRSDRLFNLFGIMAFSMGVAYLIYDKIVESRVLLIVYLLILFGSMLAYYWLNEQRWLGKHLSYRALAETLRVKFYLALAHLDGRMMVSDLIALAGVHRFRGFGLIGLVLGSFEAAPAGAPTGETSAHRGRFIERAWVDAQYQYFTRKVTEMELGTLRVKRMKMLMFAAVLVDILAMFTFGDALHKAGALTGLPVKNIMTFCSGFLAALLGVWELRQNKMATRELLWQYRNQLSQFARARTRLRRVKNPRSRENLLMKLGANSLMETYLWAIHRYHREHAPPGAH